MLPEIKNCAEAVPELINIVKEEEIVDISGRTPRISSIGPIMLPPPIPSKPTMIPATIPTI